MKSDKFILIYLLIIIFLSAGTNLGAQEDFDSLRWIAADAGLRMRDAPSLDAQKVCVIPFEAEVVLLEETGDLITIAGVEGRWSKVDWEGTVGWVFGGFLTDIPPGFIEYISEQDIIGYWSMSPEMDMGYAFDAYTVQENMPMGAEGTWYLEGNKIVIDIDCTLYDPGDGTPEHVQYTYYFEIIEFNGDHMVVEHIEEDWSETLELYKIEEE